MIAGESIEVWTHVSHRLTKQSRPLPLGMQVPVAATYAAGAGCRPEWCIYNNFNSAKAVLSGPGETRIPLMPMFGAEQMDKCPENVFESGKDDLEVLQRVVEDDSFVVENHIRSIRKIIQQGQIITTECVYNGLRLQAKEADTDDEFGLGAPQVADDHCDGAQKCVPVLQLGGVDEAAAAAAGSQGSHRLTIKRNKENGAASANLAAEETKRRTFGCWG